MKKLYFLLIIIIAGILQISLLESVRVFNIKPDLLLAVAVIASLSFKLRWAVLFSLLAGVFKDAFSPGAFGINTPLFFLWSLLVIKLRKEISTEHNSVRAGLILLITIIHHTTIGLLFVYLGKYIPFGIFLGIVSLESLYTALLSLWILKIIKGVYI